MKSGKARPRNGAPTVKDFGYLADPDGVLLEFNRNAQTEDNFYGHLHFHMGSNYPDLDAVMAHLEAKGGAILKGPYDFGDTRASLIEDLDGFGLELIETP